MSQKKVYKILSVDDWKKVGRVISFLSNNIDDLRVVGATSMNKLYTWADAAYAVHEDMKSHMGGAMLLGLGVVQTKSSKQKINAKKLTEVELIGVHEELPYNIWLNKFLKEQGYDFSQNILFQDNTSAIKLEANGQN